MADVLRKQGMGREDIAQQLPPSLKLPSGAFVICSQTIELLSMVSRNIKVSDETIQTINVITKSLLNGTDSNGWRRIPTKNNAVESSSTFRNRNFQSNQKGSGTHSRYGGNHNSSGKHHHTHGNSYINEYRPLPPQKYVSRFQNSEKNMDSHILNTIILGKLNKFSPQNYNEIKEFLEQILDSGQTDFLKEFMALVFEKAATEPIFCALYARLLGELSNKYKILIKEMEFLYGKFIHIFEEISDETTTTYNELLNANNEKTYRMGYSQFLTELMPYSVIKSEFLINVVETILNNALKIVCQSDNIKLVEEYTDCLLRILKSIAETKNAEIINLLIELKVIDKVHLLSEKNSTFKSQSAKTRFCCMDIIEMLSNSGLDNRM